MSKLQSRMTADRTYSWCKEDGTLHNENGPAIERADGTKEWYIDGKRHRDGGLPAIERKNGDREWYVNGELHRDGDLPAIDTRERKAWAVHDKFHRIGGPALEFDHGSKIWIVNGKKHRDGGLPAVEAKDGTRKWYRNGQLHREDGPAITKPDGTEEWWKNDVHLDAATVEGIKAKFRRAATEIAIIPFYGTVKAVVAPEKASFKKHAYKKYGGLRA